VSAWPQWEPGGARSLLQVQKHGGQGKMDVPVQNIPSGSGCPDSRPT
jgi:hypothetical protein